MSRRLTARIKKEEDWYVAHCPELKVTSQGKTLKSARANLQEAVDLYLETWPPDESFDPRLK